MKIYDLLSIDILRFNNRTREKMEESESFCQNLLNDQSVCLRLCTISRKCERSI